MRDIFTVYGLQFVLQRDSNSLHVDSKDTVLSVLRFLICAERHCLFWFKCLVNGFTDLRIFPQADFLPFISEGKK